MIQLKFKSKELEAEYLENLQMDLQHTGLDIEVEVIDEKDVLSGEHERSFLDSYRLDELMPREKFDEILEDEGVEARDFDLCDKETLDRIEKRFKKAIEEDDD